MKRMFSLFFDSTIIVILSLGYIYSWHIPTWYIWMLVALFGVMIPISAAGLIVGMVLIANGETLD